MNLEPNKTISRTLAGTGIRMVEADANGLISSSDTVIAGKLTNSTAIAILVNEASWSVDGLFIGTAITGTYEGMYYKSDDYFFFAEADNSWIRLARV